MNETTTKSGQLPNRRRMSSKRVLKMVRVGGEGGGGGGGGGGDFNGDEGKG